MYFHYLYFNVVNGVILGMAFSFGSNNCHWCYNIQVIIRAFESGKKNIFITGIQNGPLLDIVVDPLEGTTL